MKSSPLYRTMACALGIVLGLASVSRFAAGEEPAAKDDAAVESARKQVRMLDDLYKSAIVLITTHYVEEDSDLPAGQAFIALFDAMKEKGWHEVRLVDATGEPIEEKNSPADDFEIAAIANFKKGKDAKPTFEKIVELDGKRYLRAATPIPVVMKKCVMCHSHYEKAAPGEAIGSLVYKLPIE